jgi:L-fuculose-phosphate aldolase
MNNTLDSEPGIKDLMIDIGKRLWTRGYVAANDGNISVRISKSEMLITPSGVSKGFMFHDMIIRMTMDGKVVSPNKQYRPSSEFKMHVQVYKERDDINSVVHAHPPYSTAFAVAGIPLDKYILPEAILTIGSVPIAPYGTPSTDEFPDSMKAYIKNSDAILLANHGALTSGVDLISAYHRMETLEHTAKIVYLATNLGNLNTLSKERIEQLMEVRRRMNISGRINIPGSDD